MDGAFNGLLTVALWYEVRDTLLGQNYKRQDVCKALELAAGCSCLDAKWLLDICKKHDVDKIWKAMDAFLKEPNDARALCFAAFMCGDEKRMRRSAEMGYAFAQAWIANRTRGEEGLKWAQMAALQGERDGFRRLGTRDGFVRAAELGCVESMCSFANLFPKADPQRFFWLGKAASLGAPNRFLWEFPYQRKHDTLYAIGCALRGHVSLEKKEIFGVRYNLDAFLGSAKRAMRFFNQQNLAARRAIHAWTFVGIRLKVVKDVRRIIAALVWKERSEGNYVVAE